MSSPRSGPTRSSGYESMNAREIVAVAAGALLLLAFLFVRPDVIIAFGGIALLILGAADRRLVELSVGRDGVLIKFQRETLEKITHEGSLTADAIIDRPKSPEEFARIVENIVVRPETAHATLKTFPPTVR